MAASLAHEIGTPLNAVSGHIELLATNYPDDADTQRRIGIITKQLDYIVAVVKRLLERTHERHLIVQPTDINALIHETLSLVGPTLEKHGIIYETRLQDDLPLLYVDRDSMQQVFLNLINNSIEAMPTGGKLLIDSGLNSDSDTVRLNISDTGIGIDQETIDHLFEPMWTTKPSGSGFGLAIAQTAIIEHGGEIEVVTGTDRGATFRLTIPLRNANSRTFRIQEAMTSVG